MAAATQQQPTRTRTATVYGSPAPRNHRCTSRVYSNMGARSIPGIIIWLLCRLLRPLLGAETWDRRCACASGWSIYGLQPLKAGRGDSLVPLVQLLSIGNLVRTEVKLAAAAAVPLVKYAAEETTMASRDDSWRQETDPAGRSTAAPRRTIRTQEPARIKARLCN